MTATSDRLKAAILILAITVLGVSAISGAVRAGGTICEGAGNDCHVDPGGGGSVQHYKELR